MFEFPFLPHEVNLIIDGFRHEAVARDIVRLMEDKDCTFNCLFWKIFRAPEEEIDTINSEIAKEEILAKEDGKKYANAIVKLVLKKDSVELIEADIAAFSYTYERFIQKNRNGTSASLTAHEHRALEEAISVLEMSGLRVEKMGDIGLRVFLTRKSGRLVFEDKLYCLS
jgi:hypothetical protein